MLNLSLSYTTRAAVPLSCRRKTYSLNMTLCTYIGFTWLLTQLVRELYTRQEHDSLIFHCPAREVGSSKSQIKACLLYTSINYENKCFELMLPTFLYVLKLYISAIFIYFRFTILFQLFIQEINNVI